MTSVVCQVVKGVLWWSQVGVCAGVDRCGPGDRHLQNHSYHHPLDSSARISAGNSRRNKFSETFGVCMNQGRNIRHRHNNTGVDDVDRNSNHSPNHMIDVWAR